MVGSNPHQYFMLIKKKLQKHDFLTGGPVIQYEIPFPTDREEIIRRWQESGLLDGLTTENRINIAELMEGGAARMLREESNIIISPEHL